MEFILVDLTTKKNLDILSKISEFIEHDFLIYFLLEPDVLKLQNIETLIKQKFPNCEMVDKRVITFDGSAARQYAMGFSSIKTNRLVFQSAKTIEDLKSLLKLQLINKTCKYIEL